MDGAILTLVAPLLMKDFAIGLSTFRSGVQIALFVSIVGLYLWPWLADKFGRRNILALNIAVFSPAMPLVALSPGWGSFVPGATQKPPTQANKMRPGNATAMTVEYSDPAATSGWPCEVM